MGVRAVVEMDIDWTRDADEYYFVFRGRDGSKVRLSIAGQLFDRHGARIRKAMRKRAEAHCDVVPIRAPD